MRCDGSVSDVKRTVKILHISSEELRVSDQIAALAATVAELGTNDAEYVNELVSGGIGPQESESCWL